VSQYTSIKKIFCIGLNKTGTTSLQAFMEMHGFTTGDQAAGERLIASYSRDEYQPILDYCESAQFFQDLPFSIPGIAEVLLKKYPDAKFILTVRPTPDIWYKSLIGFHKKLFGEGERVPTKLDLKNADYRYRGFAWEANRLLYPSPEENPYREDDLKDVYINHLEKTRMLFSKSENFLEIDIESVNCVSKLASFLQINPKVERMPWKNKTSEL